MSALYAGLPTANHGAFTAQVSAPTMYSVTDNVARAPRVMDHLLSIGEHHEHDGPGDNARRIPLEDLAVTADTHRICLVSRSQRRVIEPVMLNAVESVNHVHPLVRFLTEATHALSVPCVSFDWGAAASLPFLPALRYGRAVLSPARWRLLDTELPGPHASWPEWDRALAAWQGEVTCPPAVYLGDGDQRLGLELSEPAHRALLRARLDRTGVVTLRAASVVDDAGWLGGHAHEIVVPLAATRRAAAPPLLPDPEESVSRDYGHLPGCGG